MKKLSLLMFTILILGCGTETTVVEEPPPVVEEPPPIVHPRPPVVMEEEPIGTPQIVGGNVLNGDLDADPELLNREGITLRFRAPLNMYVAEVRRDPVALLLNWSPRDIVDHGNIGNQIHLMPMADSPLLGYDAEYEVTIYAQDLACNGAWRSIKFRTKPR